jgi:hypothetical protein
MKPNNYWTPHDIHGYTRSRDELPADCAVQLPETIGREIYHVMLTHTIDDGMERDCTIIYDRDTEEYGVAYGDGRYSRARRPVGIAITRSEDYRLNAITFSADDMESCVTRSMPTYLLTPLRQYLLVPKSTECRGELVRATYEEVRQHDLTRETVIKTCRKHRLAYFEGERGLLGRVC